MRYRVVVTIEQEQPGTWDPPKKFRKGIGPWMSLEDATKVYYNTGYPWAYVGIREETM